MRSPCLAMSFFILFSKLIHGLTSLGRFVNVIFWSPPIGSTNEKRVLCLRFFAVIVQLVVFLLLKILCNLCLGLDLLICECINGWLNGMTKVYTSQYVWILVFQLNLNKKIKSICIYCNIHFFNRCLESFRCVHHYY